MCTREEVIACFQSILHRDPESEAVIQNFMSNVRDLKSLISIFLASPEYVRRITMQYHFNLDNEYSNEVQAAVLEILRMLQPINFSGFNKIRLGSAFDGGYVMLDAFESNHVHYFKCSWCLFLFLLLCESGGNRPRQEKQENQ